MGFQLTQASLKKLCKDMKMYTSLPGLNDVLHLQCKGITKLENLQEYTGLKTIYLEQNAIAVIEGLDQLLELRCLYLGRNMISDLTLGGINGDGGGGLACLTKLESLDLSENMLMSTRGLETLTGLRTLNLSGNRLRTADDLGALSALPNLTSLDLASNRIDDAAALDLLMALPLALLRLQGNPVVSATKHYRKVVTKAMASLNYLDEAPVTESDRRLAVAFVDGGVEAERAMRTQIRAEVEAKREYHRKAFDEMVERARLAPPVPHDPMRFRAVPPGESDSDEEGLPPSYRNHSKKAAKKAAAAAAAVTEIGESSSSAAAGAAELAGPSAVMPNGLQEGVAISAPQPTPVEVYVNPPVSADTTVAQHGVSDGADDTAGRETEAGQQASAALAEAAEPPRGGAARSPTAGSGPSNYDTLPSPAAAGDGGGGGAMGLQGDDFKLELRDRAIARAAARAAAAAAVAATNAGADGTGEAALVAAAAAARQPLHAAHVSPPVWGTSDYGRLWQMALQVGQQQEATEADAAAAAAAPPNTEVPARTVGGQTPLDADAANIGDTAAEGEPPYRRVDSDDLDSVLGGGTSRQAGGSGGDLDSALGSSSHAALGGAGGAAAGRRLAPGPASFADLDSALGGGTSTAPSRVEEDADEDLDSALGQPSVHQEPLNVRAHRVAVGVLDADLDSAHAHPEGDDIDSARSYNSDGSGAGGGNEPEGGRASGSRRTGGVGVGGGVGRLARGAGVWSDEDDGDDGDADDDDIGADDDDDDLDDGDRGDLLSDGEGDDHDDSNADGNDDDIADAVEARRKSDRDLFARYSISTVGGGGGGGGGGGAAPAAVNVAGKATGEASASRLSNLSPMRAAAIAAHDHLTPDSLIAPPAGVTSGVQAQLASDEVQLSGVRRPVGNVDMTAGPSGVATTDGSGGGGGVDSGDASSAAGWNSVSEFLFSKRLGLDTEVDSDVDSDDVLSRFASAAGEEDGRGASGGGGGPSLHTGSPAGGMLTGPLSKSARARRRSSAGVHPTDISGTSPTMGGVSAFGDVSISYGSARQQGIMHSGEGHAVHFPDPTASGNFGFAGTSGWGPDDGGEGDGAADGRASRNSHVQLARLSSIYADEPEELLEATLGGLPHLRSHTSLPYPEGHVAPLLEQARLVVSSPVACATVPAHSQDSYHQLAGTLHDPASLAQARAAVLGRSQSLTCASPYLTGAGPPERSGGGGGAGGSCSYRTTSGVPLGGSSTSSRTMAGSAPSLPGFWGNVRAEGSLAVLREPQGLEVEDQEAAGGTAGPSETTSSAAHASVSGDGDGAAVGSDAVELEMPDGRGGTPLFDLNDLE